MNNLLHKTSRMLSLVLRHDPGKIGITLDSSGWIEIPTLLEALHQHGFPIDRALLEEVVATNDKQRFAFNPDHSRIRANQGHSIDVQLDLKPTVPPEILWHGTVDKFLAAILREGLQKRERHHVHLSADKSVATAVGERRGIPRLLRIRSSDMNKAGHLFFRSSNGVWLTDHVPPAFIDFPQPS